MTENRPKDAENELRLGKPFSRAGKSAQRAGAAYVLPSEWSLDED